MGLPQNIECKVYFLSFNKLLADESRVSSRLLCLTLHIYNRRASNNNYAADFFFFQLIYAYMELLRRGGGTSFRASKKKNYGKFALRVGVFTHIEN